MSYTFTKVLHTSFDDAVERVTAELAARGFGILTTIDVKATLKQKIDVDVAPYMILGACNPGQARQALEVEPRIGVMLPCNVIVREVEGGVEVAAVDPVASMSAVDNPDLAEIAQRVRDSLREAVEAL